MQNKTFVTREVEVVVQTICNKCGGDCKPECGCEALGIQAWIEAGYGSPILDDAEREGYEFDLCEPCTMELIKTFVIPATRTP